MHHGHEPLLLPNAWDVASAVALAEAGYAAIGTTSLGVAAAHGWPDGQALPGVRDATLALARRLAGRLPCPYTVDIEAGFGNGNGGGNGKGLRGGNGSRGGNGCGATGAGRSEIEQVAALAVELWECGASGINLEDGLPGRDAGAGLQDPVCQAELIGAVKERAPGLFLNARIDTHWLVDTPPSLSVTLARAETYLAAGADGIFVPGVSSDEDISALVAAIPVPVNVLFAPGRHTVSRLADLGVRRISTGSLLFRTALKSALAAAASLRGARARGGSADGVPGYGDVQRLIAGEA
ncbi:isocitrate lyase/phosphoenolpyruvate mutase family protein [Streptomyces sp. NPDC093589]|uniref:isocitrate lyase/PEP mutase family protein n=1 Tax=Streptomyces sp. NPDC093589 TaxID=3366043 RepID=UPI0038238CA3